MPVDRYLIQDQNMREMVIMFMQCKAMEVVEEEDWVKLKERSLQIETANRIKAPPSFSA